MAKAKERWDQVVRLYGLLDGTLYSRSVPELTFAIDALREKRWSSARFVCTNCNNHDPECLIRNQSEFFRENKRKGEVFVFWENKGLVILRRKTKAKRKTR